MVFFALIIKDSLQEVLFLVLKNVPGSHLPSDVCPVSHHPSNQRQTWVLWVKLFPRMKTPPSPRKSEMKLVLAGIVFLLCELC